MCQPHPRFSKKNRGMRYLPGDKGYDPDRLRRTLRQAGAKPLIPGRQNRKRFIRYDKLAANFLPGVALATDVAA